MADDVDDGYPVLPVIGKLGPWLKLIHFVGVPWTITLCALGLLGGGAYCTYYYGVPIATKIMKTAESVDKKLDNLPEVNAKLDELNTHFQIAVPILQQIENNSASKKTTVGILHE